MAEQADILVANAHLLTLQGEGVGYVEDGAVAIRGSRIAAVGQTADLVARFQAAETLDATDCTVLPGTDIELRGRGQTASSLYPRVWPIGESGAILAHISNRSGRRDGLGLWK